MLPDWATGAGAATNAAGTFAGHALFGIGLQDRDPEEAPKRRVSEAERINIRRRKMVGTGQKLQGGIERERVKMGYVAAEVRTILEEAKRRIDVHVQRQALQLRVARAALDATGRAAAAPPTSPDARPGTAREAAAAAKIHAAHAAHAGRPSTAGATTTPGHHGHGHGHHHGDGHGEDKRPAFSSAAHGAYSDGTLYLDSSPLAHAGDVKKAPSYIERLRGAVDAGRSAAQGAGYRDTV